MEKDAGVMISKSVADGLGGLPTHFGVGVWGSADTFFSGVGRPLPQFG